MKLENQSGILESIYKTIEERAQNPKQESFTNYLLKSGLDKTCKKVGEEATEIIIAAKNDSKDDLVGEIADLAYMTLVLMYQRGVTVEDVANKLRERNKAKAADTFVPRKSKFNLGGDRETLTQTAP